MKRTKLLLLILAILMPMMVNADPVEIDGIYYNLVSKAKVAEVTYGAWTPNLQSYSDGRYTGEIVIPETVEYNGISYSVTAIGANAFYLCPVTSITLPQSIISIGKGAFAICNNMESINVPNSVLSIGSSAFAYCKKLTSLNIPDKLTTIDFETYAGCEGIKEFVIPNSVTTIGSNAFENCYGLETVLMSDGVTALSGTTFRDCKKLEHVKLSENLKNIGVYDFSGCSSLKEIVIPNSVSSIGSQAFADCNNLKVVTIGSGVNSIYDKAFQNCINLAIVNIEVETPIAITADVFTNADRVNAVLHVPAGCKAAYAAASIWKEFGMILEGNEGSTFIAKTTEGYDMVFTILDEEEKTCQVGYLDGASNKLAVDKDVVNGALTIPNIVTPLGSDDGYLVNKIGKYAFYGCSNLTSIVIPDGVEAIDDYAFADCINLGLVNIEVEGPIEITADVFTNSDRGNAALHVPVGCKADYADAPIWKEFGMILEGNEGSTFTAKTAEETDIVFTILDETAKTCQVGYLDGSFDKPAVNRDAVEGAVTIPEKVNDYTVVKIGKYAFDNTIKMTSVTIPTTVTSIDENAFYNCNGLTSFELPAGVSHLGSRALSSLRSVEFLKVAEGNEVYDSRGDCNAIIETATNKLLFGSKITKIPADVSEIGEYAFANLDNYTFAIPPTVTQIDDNAFYFCSNWALQVEHISPLEISENVFSDMGNTTTLRVPLGCKSDYAEATGWKNFENIVEFVNVETAGSLSDLISSEDVDAFTITDLTITGQLNGTDFRLLREMAGCDYQGRPTNGQLKKLDLSGANIVAGGDKYFDSDGLYDEEGIMQYGFNSHSVTTRDNVIGECLFAGCSKLEEIKIPTNTIEIGEFAFMCTNISSFDIPEAVEKVALPFFYGTKVSTLHIPQNVATLTASYFMGNQATLSSITVDANNAKFDSRNNCNAIIEKESNTLLLGCKNTTIPDGVTYIGEYAFSYSYGYTSITLPTSVTSLQEGAFFASGLASISLPSALKRIEFNALAYTNIASITIPASVEFIGQSALRACSNLTQVTVEAGNTKYDSRDNCNAIIETASNTLIQGCKTSTIPATVTALGNQAFQECYDLASITIPSSVTSIADNAFFQCNNLTSVSVEIKTPLVITGNTFSNRANATLYVPTGSKTAYQSADYWKEFMAIEEISMVLPADKLFSGSNLWAGYVASVDLAIPTGLGAYVITNLGTTSATASPLDYIPQGAPVLLKRDDTTITSYEFASGTGTAPTMNLLKVYDTDKNVSNREGFILYNDEFVLVNEGTLPAGRVFLPANNGLLSRGLTRSIEIDDDNATGIEDNKMFVDDAGEQWFDLQGRRLEKKPTKNGLYILNGRKVIVKKIK